MRRTTLSFLIALGTAAALAFAGFLLTAPADAGNECGPCGGPTMTVTGHGTGNNCSQALKDAYGDALDQAWAGAPACTPCQLSNGPQACAVPSCAPGPCPPGAYRGSWTLSFKCQACEIGPPEGPSP